MNAADFYRQIKEKALRHAYCFSGPEEWIKRDALEKLRTALLPAGLESLNDVTLDAPALPQVRDAALTLPFMCEKRIVVVRDYAPFHSEKLKGSDPLVEGLKEWLDQPNDTCVTVFYNHGTVASKELTKIFKERDLLVEFGRLTESEIQRWAGQRLKPLGKQIDANAVTELVDRAGQDLTQLAGELDKLAAYTDTRPRIKLADVQAVVPPSLESNVFEMIRLLLNGEVHDANAFLDQLLFNGEKPISILALLIRQMRQLCHIRLALDARRPAEDAAKLLGMNPRAVYPVSKEARRLEASAFKALYLYCIELDFAAKSGEIRDIEAVNMAMMRIGEAVKRRKA